MRGDLMEPTAPSRPAAASFMLIAGEPSGDLLAAELVRALQQATGSAPSQSKAPSTSSGRGPSRPRFFGAGGPHMAQAGVELAVDMTRHAVVGLVEVFKNFRQFKRLFDQLLELALARRPEFIVCVDFSGFNRRFARQIRWELQVRNITDWRPRLIQYVSPQVWASRPGRAQAMARDFDRVGRTHMSASLGRFPIEAVEVGRRAVLGGFALRRFA